MALPCARAARFGDGAAKDADTVKRYVAAYEGIGCDELIFCPSSADLQQVDLLASNPTWRRIETESE